MIVNREKKIFKCFKAMHFFCTYLLEVKIFHTPLASHLINFLAVLFEFQPLLLAPQPSKLYGWVKPLPPPEKIALFPFFIAKKVFSHCYISFK